MSDISKSQFVIVILLTLLTAPMLLAQESRPTPDTSGQQADAKPIVAPVVSNEETKPTLEQLMAAFAKHEAAYLPFHIHAQPEVSAIEKPRDKSSTRNLFSPPFRVIEFAQRGDYEWLKLTKVAEYGPPKKSAMSVLFGEQSTSEAEYAFSHEIPGGRVRKQRPGEERFRFIPEVFPLWGLFPVATVHANGARLSQIYREEPSRFSLEWDGEDAKITLAGYQSDLPPVWPGL